jgi:D-3-phosphoglycerate dehydrogenase
MVKVARKLEVLVLNPIAQVGLKRLPAERFTIVKEAKSPDAILVRSADMHGMSFDANLKAVARAGAGVNNIPIAELSKLGVPVFNAPGARLKTLP